MRVLDLGCGKGITSVFLAREFGVQVYAADFDQWGDSTTPEVRWNNAKKHGVEHLIIPITADARNLPFAQGFFDAIVCVDAYIYFGQDDTFLKNILKFLRPDDQLGMIVPGFMKDTIDGIPNYIQKFLGDELWTWRTLPWWRNLWEKTRLVTIDVADNLPDSCTHWLRWEKALLDSGRSQ